MTYDGDNLAEGRASAEAQVAKNQCTHDAGGLTILMYLCGIVHMIR